MQHSKQQKLVRAVMASRFAVTIIGMVMLWCASSAQAATYAINASADSDLVSVNVATGATSSLPGSTGHRVTGLSQDPVTGTWYAITEATDGTWPSHLATIDLTTSTLTDIGAEGFDITGISFDGNGNLYGWGSTLYSISTATGAATAIGGSTLFAGPQSIAFSSSGVLWGMLDGDAASVQHLSASTGGSLGSIALSGPNMGAGGGMGAATQSCSADTLFVVDQDSGGTTFSLTSVNTATGQIASIGSMTGTIWAIASSCHTQLAMASPAVSVAESSGNAQVTVERTLGMLGPAHVDFTTAVGSASSADFTATAGTLDFGSGETSKIINIPVTDDLETEAGESFDVILSNPTAGPGALLGGTTTTVTIAGNDIDVTAPSLSVVAPKRVRYSKFKASGIKVTATCGEACTLNAKLTGRKSAPKNHPLVVVSKVSSSGASGTGRKLKLRLTKAGKAWLGRLPKGTVVKLKLTVTAKDSAGNSRVGTKAIRLVR